MAKNLDYPIEKLIPHRGPMILIDALEEADEDHAICSLTIGQDSLFLEQGGIPAFVGIELMAQTVAAQAGFLALQKGEPVKVGLLLGTPRLTMACAQFQVGQKLRIEARRDWGDDQLMRYGCDIFDQVRGDLLQQAELNVFQPRNLEAYLQQTSQKSET